ncbi:uncharacterized protein LOC130786574 isoform X2 [Actinidia eriantha]|uniref:uncharacterized protein LOC130786574 isoform X2 n=1 Tax=Actinidia eriantha TaxID=165200 RepID=UPI0025895B3E|nr:uncharacterized protein LOC130786574 isoform X2 [Actinidia eriantha]
MTTNPNYSNCISNSKEEEEAMLSDREETPTRLELLSMVKKHSKLLGKTIVDKEDASDVEMDSRFWHGVMDLYFVRGRESRGRQDDDLVFFVRKLILQGYGSSDDMEGNSPYFVRRWAPKLDALVDRDSVHVDWRSSFYLNLIAHTSFSVTVAICSHQILRNHQSGNDTPLSSIYKVVKTVYASPSRVDFHLDSTKEVETTPAYPDICFAVDDFDSTFDAVVLTDTDHCYCVLLNADGGAAFPGAKPAQDCSSSDTLRSSTGSAKTKKTKLTLFSGFVNYQMVRDAYEDQSKEGSSPTSQSSKRGFGFGTIVRRAASVASVAAKHAYAAAAATRGPDEEMLPLKCCLMSISLPWEDIAYDLLFKGSPPVNL